MHSRRKIIQIEYVRINDYYLRKYFSIIYRHFEEK